MSTIHASNFGDGTNTVESGYILGGIKVRCYSSSGTTIYDSMNISSLTDAGVGIPAFNFTNAFETSNAYTPTLTVMADHTNSGYHHYNGRTSYTSKTSAVIYGQTGYYNGSDGYADMYSGLLISGDLA